MGKYDEIVQKIAQIINLCNSAYVYRVECSCVAKTLNEIRDQISNLPSKSDNDEFDTILSKLNKLYNIVESFNAEKWTQTNLQVPVSKPISDINETMSSISESLQKIGITLTNNFQTSVDNISNDLNSIYGILANPIKLKDPEVKTKLEEIEQYLKEIGKPLISSQPPKPKDTNSDIHTSSTTDTSAQFPDYDDVQKYKLKQSDILYEGPPLTQNEIYSIYTGKIKDTIDDVTVTVIDSKSFNEYKFKRFINVLTAFNQSNLETFIGTNENDKFENDKLGTNENPPPFIVVTKANGEKLSDIINRQNDLKKGEIDEIDLDANDAALMLDNYKTIIAFQIATAMAYLHSKGIIHRDLCSENVKIDNEFNARVTNFVSSRFVPKDNILMTYKPSSSSHFKAPELNNPDGYNEMVDVFAFGGILYELLTGEVPFKGESAQKVEYKIGHKDRPKFPPKTDKDLRELIESCWAQDSNNRPSFATIIDTMLTKSITFPCDKECEITKQFYDAKMIRNVGLKSCFDLLNQAQEAINNSFVYKQELFRIRTLLYGYHFLLETSEYARLPKIEDQNVNTQIVNLKSALENLLLTLKETEINKWSTIALSTKSLEIPNELHSFMELIYISLKQIGFDVNKYSFVQCDLQSDLRHIYAIFQDNGSVKARKRMAEIEEYMYENDIELEITEDEINVKIKHLLNSWNDHIVNRDDFELQENLGEGVSCQVYSAIQKSTGQTVAIKMLSSDYIDNDDKVLLLRREIASLMSLKNEYLVEFVGFNIDPDVPLWIVMKKVEGGSLEDAVLQNSLDAIQKTKIAFEVAQGMEYLNLHNIIHRDLKSGNILLEDPESVEVKPKICDFGYARSDLSSSINMTSHVGTEYYMAPEVILGEHYNFKADVFSFGLVLYELYANRTPYYWVQKSNILRYITENKPLRYEEPINDNLKKLIEDCKNFDPDLRPSFTEIIERMIDEKITFEDEYLDEEDVDEFYKKKIDERNK